MNNEYDEYLTEIFPIGLSNDFYDANCVLNFWIKNGTESQDPLCFAHDFPVSTVSLICLCPFLIGLTMLTRNGRHSLARKGQALNSVQGAPDEFE